MPKKKRLRIAGESPLVESLRTNLHSWARGRKHSLFIYKGKEKGLRLAMLIEAEEKSDFLDFLEGWLKQTIAQARRAG